MTYQEAINESINRTWVIGTCSEGEKCWCRTIRCVPPLLFEDGEHKEEYYVVRTGEVHKELVEYIVKLHNEKMEATNEQR